MEPEDRLNQWYCGWDRWRWTLGRLEFSVHNEIDIVTHFAEIFMYMDKTR
jgi:hypothetical protein